MYNLSNILLTKQWPKNTLKGYLKIFWDKVKWNITYQNLYNTAKAVTRGNLGAVNSYIEKEKRSQVKNIKSYLKELQKRE
jgi:hypothetical protein